MSFAAMALITACVVLILNAVCLAATVKAHKVRSGALGRIHNWHGSMETPFGTLRITTPMQLADGAMHFTAKGVATGSWWAKEPALCEVRGIDGAVVWRGVTSLDLDGNVEPGSAVTLYLDLRSDSRE